MICSPWRPLSAIKSTVESKLPTMNYLSHWKPHLCHKIDGASSEVSRTSIRTIILASSLGLAWGMPLMMTSVFNLAHAQPVHVLIVLLCVHGRLPLFCLSTQSCSLAALIATVITCMDVSSCMQHRYLCMQSSMVYNAFSQCAQIFYNHHRGVSTFN